MGVGRTSGKCENKQFETNVDFSRVMMKKIEVQKEREKERENYKIENYTSRLKKNQAKRRNEKKRKLEVCQDKENKIALKKKESFNNNILKDKHKCDPVKKEANKSRAKETKKRKTREDV